VDEQQQGGLADDIVAAVARRYRALSSYIGEVIPSLVEAERDWGFGVDRLDPEAQYRWLEEVREMQRERTALDDVIIASARAPLPYRSIPAPGPGEDTAR
jgi:hypothetical protein